MVSKRLLRHTMAMTRLDGDERRKAIVAAAVPLFARKGFAGTTTKELAEAAGISEALLFRHFPSKKHLYDEILRLGCEGHPALECLAALAPSTASLIQMTHFMVRYFLLGGGADRIELDTRLRLILHSLLEDGEYARELFDRMFELIHPLFAASVEAAVAAGDLSPDVIETTNRFWFGHHVAAMVAFVFLPGRAAITYEGPSAALVEEASRFILRGIGLKDAAIAAALAACAKSPLEFAPS
jgi:TetR/AcrR family transcriptional regulator, transcriptional repressor of aconitase